MSQKIRAYLVVKGIVQGVGYRFETLRKAQNLGIFGFVRNLPDGKVEMVLEGEKKKVDKMIQWARSGPSLASVDGLEINYREYKGEFNNFEIRT